MADAHINETAFVPVSEIECYKDGWGEVGFVVCYRTWSYASVSVMIIPQYPPYGDVNENV